MSPSTTAPTRRGTHRRPRRNPVLRQRPAGVRYEESEFASAHVLEYRAGGYSWR